MDSIYFFSTLPVPGAKHLKHYRCSEEHEREEERYIAMKKIELDAARNARVEYSSCSHPDSMIDESSNTCTSCGICIGAVVSKFTESSIGFSGSHYHTFSSAAASATARKKRAAIALSSTSTQMVLYINNSPEALSSSQQSSDASIRGGGVKTRNDIIVNKKIIPFMDVEIQNKQQLVIIQPPLLADVDKHERRIMFLVANIENLFISSLPGEKFELDGILASGAYNYMNREACPVAMNKVIKSGCEKIAMDIALEINKQVIEDVYNVVSKNIDYFNSAQRRRLHHLSLFVVIVTAHINIVHGGCIKSAESCLELDRVRARAKPSQSKFTRRSFVSAIGDFLGVNTTCSTRLVQEACGLVSVKEE